MKGFLSRYHGLLCYSTINETGYGWDTTFNPHLPNVTFRPPESIRKPKVFLCFQGSQKVALWRKGSKLLTHGKAIFNKNNTPQKKRISQQITIFSQQWKPSKHFGTVVFWMKEKYQDNLVQNNFENKISVYANLLIFNIMQNKCRVKWETKI